ncbi:hypothetical protein BC828DRAFT_408908 [Blastocladiella britannica]|nr:hypothetical protein BC828DRAFT_408908 [Blastocladiella britannica]
MSWAGGDDSQRSAPGSAGLPEVMAMPEPTQQLPFKRPDQQQRSTEILSMPDPVPVSLYDGQPQPILSQQMPIPIPFAMPLPTPLNIAVPLPLATHTDPPFPLPMDPVMVSMPAPIPIVPMPIVPIAPMVAPMPIAPMPIAPIAPVPIVSAAVGGGITASSSILPAPISIMQYATSTRSSTVGGSSHVPLNFTGANTFESSPTEDFPAPVTLDSADSSVQGSIASLSGRNGGGGNGGGIRSGTAAASGETELNNIRTSLPTVSVLDDDDPDGLALMGRSVGESDAANGGSGGSSGNGGGRTRAATTVAKFSPLVVGANAGSDPARFRSSSMSTPRTSETPPTSATPLLLAHEGHGGESPRRATMAATGAGVPLQPRHSRPQLTPQISEVDGAATVAETAPAVSSLDSVDSIEQDGSVRGRPVLSSRGASGLALVESGKPSRQTSANALLNGSQAILATAQMTSPQSQLAVNTYASQLGPARPRSETVASRISGYNLKFRASAAQPGSSSTIRKFSAVGGVVLPGMAGDANVVPLAGADDIAAGGTGGGVLAAHSRPDDGSDGDLAKRRTVRGSTNTLGPSPPSGHLPADAKRSKRLMIDNHRAKLTGFDAALLNMRRRIRQNFTALARRALFQGSLKTIEGRFGTAIASYFAIARSILILNFVLATLWVSVVMVIGFVSLLDPYIYPNGTVSNMSKLQYVRNSLAFDSKTIVNFFSGLGVWQEMPLFYSALSPVMLFNLYRMDLAYVFTVLMAVAVSFIGILKRMRDEYVNKAGMSTGVGQDEVYPMAVTAFASWNHCIEIASMKENQVFAIATAFKTIISQLELAGRRTELKGRALFLIILRRTITNIISFGLLAGAGWLIWDAVSACTSPVNTFFFNIVDVLSGTKDPNVNHCPDPTSTTPFPPYVVSISNAVLPSLFAMLAKFEKYSDPQWETRSTLARSYLIKIAGIYLMLFSMYTLTLNPASGCWEHEIAMRFYYLLWLDVVVSTLSTVLTAVLTKRIWGTYEFDITSNILELVYRQAVIWIGSTYAPFLPVASLFTTTIIFYVKRFTVLRWAQPPKRIFNSYTQVIWFLVFMLMTLILMAVPALFAIAALQPSQTCGPYRVVPGYSFRFGVGEGAFTVINKSINAMQDIGGKGVLNLFGSIVVIGPVLAAMGLWVYFLLAVSKKRRSRLLELEKEVKEEREDKKKLIRMYGVQT